MGKPLIIVTSITYALKGKDLLNKAKISARLVRTPGRNNVGGCGYSIYVPNQTDKAEKILRKNGINIIARTDWEGIT